MGPVMGWYLGAVLAIAAAGIGLEYSILSVEANSSGGSWGESCDVCDDISVTRAARGEGSRLMGVKHATMGVFVYLAAAALVLARGLTGAYWPVLGLIALAVW